MSVLMTMMKSVSERTREIGTLRSLGFLRRHIVGLFALNGAGITYKAGVLSESIPLVVGVSPRAYVFGFVFLTGVAIAAALLPARRAARMGIPEALGHV